MASEIVMPQMGAEMEEGTLVRWVKQPGDFVNRGDIIAEIETDKATVDLESFDQGYFLGGVAEPGVALPVGTVIGYLGAEGEALPGSAGTPPTAAPAAPTEQHAAEAPSPVASGNEAPMPSGAAMPSQQPGGAPRPEGQPLAGASGAEESPSRALPPPPAPSIPAVPTNGARAATPAPVETPSAGRLRASPVARSIAEELGIDLGRVQGSGPDGRIMRRDVEEFARQQSSAAVPAASAPVPVVVEEHTPAVEAQQPATAARPPREQPVPAPEPARAAVAGELEPLSKMRQTIARRMSAAKREMPHYYLTMTADMTAALTLRREFNAVLPAEQRISVNDLILKASALALERYPRFNMTFTEEGLRRHEAISIGVAVALEDGLIVPAVLDCQGKSLGAIARQAADVTERARSGRLRPAELSGGTFTVSNLGMYGVETLIAIIQPGQAAILGVGRSDQQPVVRDGQVVVRDMMTLALSADHRVTDGAQGAQFLAYIRELLEQPVRLAL